MIEVRAGTDADRPGILQLLEAVFGPGQARRTDQLWDWQWQRDPRLPRPGYRGAVALWGDRVIGSVGFMPAALHAHGEPMAAVWAVDGAVHFGWMRQALKKQRAAAKAAGTRTKGKRGGSIAAELLNHPIAGPMILGKLVSTPMQVVGRKIGFHDVEGSGYLARNLSFTPRIARFTGALVAPVLGLLPNLVAGRIARAPATVSVHEGEFDTGFDALWARCGGDYPCVARRDAIVLNWRYRNHPFRSYTTIVDRKGDLVRGYAVVTTFEKRRCLRGRIVDLFTRWEDESVAHGLLAGALRELRRQGADRVDCYLADDTLVPALGSVGFVRRSGYVPLMVRWPGAEAPLYVLAGDGDGG
jgi:hypothetical protein